MAESAARPHPALEHQFGSLEQQHEASSLGMWVFLSTEVLFFSGLFVAYLLYRLWYPEAFAAASHHMDVTLGTTNTAVLIVSSLSVALAVQAGRTGPARLQVLWLLVTIVLGLAFLGIKAIEYHDHITHQLLPGAGFRWDGRPALAPQAELFFSLYFVMTGLHAVHVIIGVGLMVVMAGLAVLGRFTAEYHSPLEMSGLYWHFVDVVWIFLFPMLYLIDRHT